jgi:glycosyltransferase involved in cell wall biosynthesis
MITGAGSVLAGGPGLRRRILGAVLRTLYLVALRGDHVVFFQNPDDEWLFRRGRMIGSGQRVVRVNGSGVDLTRFTERPLPEPPVRFLMLARLIRDKGVLEYHEAARVVRASRPDVRIQLLGSVDPNPTAVSPAQLDAWRAEGAVEYLGSTRDVRPFLEAAHVCVLPSYGEGMPRSVLEAMAMGRPIVTTDVPGCRETVVNGENGILVRPRDSASLAAGMLRMLADPGALADMGRASRRLAEERFDVRDVNRQILVGMNLA